jgi:hypothetical protein
MQQVDRLEVLAGGDAAPQAEDGEVLAGSCALALIP